MVNLLKLKTDTLRKMYKKLNPDTTFAVIKSYNKCQLAEKLDYSDDILKKTLKSVTKIPVEKTIKTPRDYLNTLNKYQIRFIAGKLDVSGLSRNKTDIINDIIKKNNSLNELKKIKL